MRIIGGKFRSRPLRARVPVGTRPTSDRLRETLFNILGPRIIESVFLDAYAGTGAIGIEALSRGARQVYFVERSAAAVRAIRQNLESLGVGEGVRILNTEIRRALAICVRDGVRFDLVFLDPPYDDEHLYGSVLGSLDAEGLLSPEAWVVAEHPVRLALPGSLGRLVCVRQRKQGSSALSFYQVEEATVEAGRGDLSGDV